MSSNPARAITLAPTADPHADVTALRRSLEASAGPVVVHETHCSVVFLVEDRAFKLRKPVDFDFVDFRSSGARARACEREVELNAALAPGVVLGVRAVVPHDSGGGYELVDADDPRAVDHVVEMRRFDEADTMRQRAEHRTLTLDHASAIGARVAAFHRDAEVSRGGVDYRALVDRNFEALLPALDGLITLAERLALQRFAAAFLLEWSVVLTARAATGHVLDGHGDLRAEHVLLEPEGVLIVDRLEYDELRMLDVADELAFLLMDLAELPSGEAVGEAVLAGYQAAGGGAPPASLIAFFGAYRAQVRAKVALLRAAQPGVDARALRAQARRLLALSRRLGWRARGPLLLLVTGPPGSGKSTLATALGDSSGLPVLSSDLIRRQQPSTVDSYTLAERAGVYRELARLADPLEAVIVDATFGEVDLQRAFTDTLSGGLGAVTLAIECRAPHEVRITRAQTRKDSASDAGSAVARVLGDRFLGITGLDEDARLAIDTEAPLAMQVDEVASWLDALLAGGRTS